MVDEVFHGFSIDLALRGDATRCDAIIKINEDFA
jgi:hypothetical protein